MAAGTAAEPGQTTARRHIELPGRIEAFEQARLDARVPGFVQKVHADIGDRVRKGQVLAELAVPELEQEHRQKQALVAQAEAEVVQARGALQVAEAALALAQAEAAGAQAGVKHAQALRARAKARFERLGKASEVLDRQALDEARSQLEVAEAAVGGAEAKVRAAGAAREESAARRDKAQADLKVAEARLEVARADRTRLEILLQYAQVRAPFDGLVTRRGAATGDFAGLARNDGENPLFVVMRVDAVRVAFDVPESAALRVGVGDRVMIRVGALGKDLAAKVTRTTWVLDPRTRTLRTESDLPNADGKLLPGMSATVSLTLEGEGPRDEEAPKPAAKDGGNVEALAQARADAARKAYDEAAKGLQQTKRTGASLTTVTTPGEVYAWSVRWLNAVRETVSTKEDRVAALEAHVMRMKELQLRVTEMARSGLLAPLEVSAAEFYRVESELWLAREKAR
jgi:multidrug efflux pump subunit AcrA (membrane-fusion protein)